MVCTCTKDLPLSHFIDLQIPFHRIKDRYFHWYDFIHPRGWHILPPTLDDFFYMFVGQLEESNQDVIIRGDEDQCSGDDSNSIHTIYIGSPSHYIRLFFWNLTDIICYKKYVYCLSIASSDENEMMRIYVFDGDGKFKKLIWRKMPVRSSPQETMLFVDDWIILKWDQTFFCGLNPLVVPEE